jgi:hypothetical protein
MAPLASKCRARWQPAYILLAAWLAVGCATPETKLVEKEIAEFHTLIEGGRAAEIYAKASPRFREVGTSADFLAYIGAVHRKLGAMQATERQVWRMDYNTAGKFASLGYKTLYERGTAYEQFVYVVDSGRALLVSYNINSPELVTR